MAQIEGIRIQNFRSMRDLTLGRVLDDRTGEPLTPITAVIGKNGVGKTSLFDAFGFISDCLKTDVEEASYLQLRGGFDLLRTMGITKPMSFQIVYRENSISQPITYDLQIDKDKSGRPFVKTERLRQKRAGQETGEPFSFLYLKKGQGTAWKGTTASDDGVESTDQEEISLANNRALGIATLGSLKTHPRIVRFRDFIHNWYLSYFLPNAAKNQPPAGSQSRLTVQGDNLANVIQYLERDHSKIFNKILADISEKIPGINRITSKRLEDGKLLLCFNDNAFVDPFFSFQMSDGTLKLLAYLIMLNDPTPPSFMGIEEPENGLYPELLGILVNEFREHTLRSEKRSQIFITTHQPLILDALKADEVWVMTKDVQGYSHLRRANSDEVIKRLNIETFPMGQMWSSGYLD